MKRSNLEKYYLSIAPVKLMVDKGVITKQDYLKAESLLADKYCIKNGSLYRLIDLTIPRNRVIDM
ncbi:MAG: SHOCT domain-containing protein, partial [Bacilli bacterium]